MLKNMALVLVGGLLAVAGFMAGRSSAPKDIKVNQAIPGLIRVQNTQTVPQPNNDARELIPLNPGGQQPGQGQQPPPGQGQQPQDCPVQIYQDGKLYTFPQPGQQNGNQPGRGGQPQELVPLQPNAPSTTPQPNTPAQPRAVPIQPSTPTPSTPTPSTPTPSTPNTPSDPENPLNPFAPTLPNTRS